MKDKGLATTYFMGVMVIMIATFMISYSIGLNKKAKAVADESFYEVVKVNDSTIHFNMNDNSCALVSLWADTIKVSTHNCYGVNYDKDHHDITVRAKRSDTIFMKTVNLDMWFENVPEIPYFILDIN